MNASHSEFLVQIQKRRLTLERLITIAKDIERMNQGLNAVLQLDNISFEIPEEIQSFLTLISKSIKDTSTNNVTETLNSLDHRVHKSLKKVLNKALFEISRDMDKEEFESTSKELSNVIDQFKKDVQTTIGLRLLLKERGADIPHFRCAVPINTIKDRIEKLEEREEIFRNKINNKIDNMLEEISVFLNDDTLPNHMKEEILKVHDELCLKKDHLQSGKELSDTPMIMESIELKTDDEEIEYLVTEAERKIILTQPAQELKIKPRGLFERIRIWFSTPLEVGWKETKHHPKK